MGRGWKNSRPLSDEQRHILDGLIDRSSEAFSWKRESDD